MTDSSHLQLYVDESREKLTELNNALLTLESDGDDREALDMSFRSAHTLKGNSKAMGYDAVGDLAHAVEDLLDGMRDGEIEVTPETMDLAFAGLDEIEAAMAEISESGDVERDPEPVMREIRDGVDGLTEGDRLTEDDGLEADDGRATDDGLEADDGQAADDGRSAGDGSTGAEPTSAAGRSGDVDAEGDASSEPERDGSLPRHRFEVGMEMGPIPGADALLVLEKVERTASIDATDPVRHAVENGEYDGGFDVFVRTDEPDEVASVIRNERAVTDVSVTDAPDTDADDEGPDGDESAAAAVTDAEPATDDPDANGRATDDSRVADESAVDEPTADGSVTDEPKPDEPAAEAPEADDESTSEPGVVARFTRGVRGSLRASVAALRSLPQLTAGQVTSASAGTASRQPADGDESRSSDESADDAGDSSGADADATDVDATEADAADAVEADAVDAGTIDDGGTAAADVAADPDDRDGTASNDEDLGDEGPSNDDLNGEDPPGDDPSGSSDDGSVDDSSDDGSVDDSSDGDSAADGSSDGDSPADDSSTDDSESSSGSGVSSVRIDVDRLDELYGIVEQLYTNRIRLRRIVEAAGVDEAQEQLDALDKNTTQLQDAVMDMRLVPLSRVLDRFPRTVRDLARDQDKEIDLQIEGDGVEVDRVVLDEISDPLMHLVRNAVDHGIEPPAEREAAGKDPEGTLSVRGRRERDQVVIEVADDGQGLDADDLRDRAVDEGVHTREEVEALSDAEAYELIFHSGFSTAEEVTDVSGRGVGMDVVRQCVTELDGSVSIDSELGEGTTVTLRLPVTVAIVEVLFVDVGEDSYGIPIKEIDRVSRDEGIQTVNGRRSIEYEDTIYPVIDLNEFFDGETPEPDADRRLVRIHPDRRQIAILCDSVHDHEEVVVKPLAGPVANTPGLSGTTVLGDGDVVPIVDVQSIGG